MARKYLTTAVRLIPNFNMTEPWSTPLSAETMEGIASSALLGGAQQTNRSVTALLSQFAGDYVQNLGKAGKQ